MALPAFFCTSVIHLRCPSRVAKSRPRNVLPHDRQPRPRLRARRACNRAAFQGLEGFAESLLRPGDNDVRVVQVDKLKSRHVLAEVAVHASVDEVWAVLTDYERLPEFVPNLELCERVPGAPRGRARIRQRGASQSPFWRLEAGAVLEVTEARGPLGRRELRFTMLEGDFQELSGKWVVEPNPRVRDAAGIATILRYELCVVPRWSLPSTLVSCVVRAGLPANVRAIARQAEQKARSKLEAPGFAAGALRDEVTAVVPNAAGALPPAPRDGEIIPAKGPARGPWLPTVRLKAPQPAMPPAATSRALDYLGMTSVPLPTAAAQQAQRATREAETRRQREALQALYPAFAAAPHGEGALEVHLRRLDGNAGLHRRAVALIHVDAPPADVWAVLTDYERLPDVVPNLASCERLAPPPGAHGRAVVRLRQVGYKAMQYLQLHAEAVLDVVEVAPREIQFRAVAGDFGTLQGKFMLEATEPEVELVRGGGGASTIARTALRYAVEVRIPSAAPGLGLAEPLLETCVFADLPANLAALAAAAKRRGLQRRAAQLEAQGEARRAAALRRRSARPRLGEMAANWGVLAGELERNFGAERVLPTRAQLRALGRSDLEKAIAAHGGFPAVAERLKWQPPHVAPRKRGYWDVLANVRSEIDAFCAAQGLAPGTMPRKKDFVGAGRFDLSKVVERWGGLYKLAGELEYPVASRQSVGEWQHHIAATAAATGLSGQNGLFQAAARTYRARSLPAGNGHDGPEPFAAQRAQHAGECGREPGRAPAASAAMGPVLQQVPAHSGLTGSEAMLAIAEEDAESLTEGAASAREVRKHDEQPAGLEAAARQPGRRGTKLSLRDEIDKW